MKLTSATIRKYRVHRELALEFDPRITLVVGTNESGKSTLAEALHRGLFFRAKAGGKWRDRMDSRWGEPPQVSLVFEAGGCAVNVEKTFRANRGECMLRIAGQPQLSGDAAEERLAQLLNAGPPIGGKGAEGLLDKRWAHLWAWQGQSGFTPMSTLDEQRDALVRRLQQDGATAVTQSDLDARVLRSIQAQRDALFKEREGGGWRKGSGPARAEEQLAGARQRLESCQKTVADLEDAVQRHARATQEIAERTQARAGNEAERDSAQKKLQEAEGLQREIEPLERAIEDTTARRKALEKVGLDLAAAREERDRAQAALQPLESKLQELQQERAAAADRLQDGESVWGQTRADAGGKRLRKNALDAHLQALQRKLELDRLTVLRAAIDQKREQLKAAQEKLLTTPPVEARDLAALEDLGRAQTAAQATLDALGARVELVSSREPVTVAGRPLAAGTEVIALGDVDLAIGKAATLRIKPGGKTGLVDARQALEEIREKLRAKLDDLGMASPETARAAHEARKALVLEVKTLQKDLERMDAEGTEEALRQCAQALATAKARVENAVRECGYPLPAEVTETQAACDVADRESGEAEKAEADAVTALQLARTRCEKTEADVAKAAAGADDVRRLSRDTQIRIQTIENQHGTDQARAEELVALRARQDNAQARWYALKQRLDVLQPDLLKTTVERLNKSIQNAEVAIRNASDARIAATARLAQDGVTDPRAALENARADVERAQREQNTVKAEADAIRYLADMAEEVQRSISERINKPLEDAAQGYLACIFGAGVRVTLTEGLQASEAPGIRLNREQGGLGTFDFDALSGGTREQVGIAMRLAMAQVLARDHDGVLPVVLDDAFANSDPDRIRMLQGMLYRAAEQGLQIIVLTSNPLDYSGLGAKETRLERPVLQGAPPRPPSPADSYETEETQTVSAGAASERDKKAFVDKLASLGGKSGNQSLREALTWTPDRYEAVKEALVQANAIALGQGRGGSVRLAEGQNERER